MTDIVNKLIKSATCSPSIHYGIISDCHEIPHDYIVTAESDNLDLDSVVRTENDATDVKQFTTYLSVGNVDKKTHGLVSIGFELIKGFF